MVDTFAMVTLWPTRGGPGRYVQHSGRHGGRRKEYRGTEGQIGVSAKLPRSSFKQGCSSLDGMPPPSTNRRHELDERYYFWQRRWSRESWITPSRGSRRCGSGQCYRRRSIDSRPKYFLLQHPLLSPLQTCSNTRAFSSRSVSLRPPRNLFPSLLVCIDPQTLLWCRRPPQSQSKPILAIRWSPTTLAHNTLLQASEDCQNKGLLGFSIRWELYAYENAVLGWDGDVWSCESRSCSIWMGRIRADDEGGIGSILRMAWWRAAWLGWRRSWGRWCGRQGRTEGVCGAGARIGESPERKGYTCSWRADFRPGRQD